MRFKNSNEHGFTLVELMIVVAIIGILAAIAIPQFAAYRTRSMNANAKALNKMVVGSQSDLNAELGCYGETEVAAVTLIAGVAGPGAGAIMDSTGDTLQAVAATALAAGGRISGNNDGSGKTFAVPLGIGANMVTLSNTPVANAGINQATSFLVFTKHTQGDSVYGSDSDSPNTIYSVSHAGWTGNATNNRLQAATFAAVSNVNDFDGDNDPATADINGAGAPTANWAMVQ